MPILYLTKLTQKGKVHPLYFENSQMNIFLFEQNLDDITLNKVLQLQEFKLQIGSIISDMPGYVVSLFFAGEANYVYYGSLWNDLESFNFMLSFVESNHKDVITSYNSLRKDFFNRFQIESSKGKLFSVNDPENYMLSIDRVDNLMLLESIPLTTIFDLNE